MSDSRWDVRSHLSADTGQSVLVAYTLASDGFDLLTPDEARDLALRIWEAADAAEGLVYSQTEPSPGKTD